MSLFDVDKSSVDRGSPNPNRHDQLIDGAVKNHATHSINPISDATTQTGFISQKNQQVIAYDGTANKALMGYNSALNKWGFFVADDGVDVTTNSDPSQLIFNSSQDMFKIVQTGTTTKSPPSSWSNGNVQTITISHGLGFKPAFLVYVTNPDLSGVGYINSNNLTNLPSTIYVTSGGSSIIISTADVDTSNLYIHLLNLSGGTASGLDAYTWTYKYYILQETAS